MGIWFFTNILNLIIAWLLQWLSFHEMSISQPQQLVGAFTAMLQQVILAA